MRDDILPHVVDVDVRNKILKSLDKNGNKDESVPKRKRARRTSCKWCGSTTHLKRNHKDCPHNPKNANPPPSTQSPTPEPTPTPPTTTNNQTPTAPPPTTTNNRTPTPPPPTIATNQTPTPAKRMMRRYNIHENVTARWSRNKWFHAQVTHVHPDMRYTVYFPDDGKVKTNVRHQDIHPQTTVNPTPKRGDMIGKEFYEEGDENFRSGRFRVDEMEENTYHCTRLSGGGCSSEYFDIGYVMSLIRTADELERED